MYVSQKHEQAKRCNFPNEVDLHASVQDCSAEAAEVVKLDKDEDMGEINPEILIMFFHYQRNILKRLNIKKLLFSLFFRHQDEQIGAFKKTSGTWSL